MTSPITMVCTGLRILRKTGERTRRTGSTHRHSSGDEMTDGWIDGKEHPAPHCNAEVLHAPGECYYCDKYPQRQQVRAASGTPFTPNAANGWSGNVAAKPGEPHTHMGATWVVGEDTPHFAVVGRDDERVLHEGVAQFKCGRPPRGWYCKKRAGHTGPCPTRARWWMKPIVRVRKGFWP